MLNFKLQRSHIEAWISQIHASHAITLNPNLPDLPIEGLRTKFKRFCLEIDRLKLGRQNPQRRESADRFSALAFPEHLASNPHLHVAARLDRLWFGREIDDRLNWKIECIWKRITNGSGQLVLKEIYSAPGWAKYITKELAFLPHDRLREDVDFFWSADFHPGEKVVQSGDMYRAIDQLQRQLA